MTVIDKKDKDSLEKQRKLVAVAAVVMLLVMTVAAWQQSGTQQLAVVVHTPTLDEIRKRPALDLSRFESCTVAPIADIPDKETLMNLKPFWVPSFPASDDGLFRKLVAGLTDSKATSKSYYAKAKGLRKCKGNTPTAACEQIHPVVGIGPPPDEQASKFQSQLIVMIRNPATAIPAHHQTKAVLYHEQEGQVALDGWREFRDTFLEQGLFQNWKSVVDAWSAMTSYTIGLYVPFEHLVDIERGPDLAVKLGTMLRRAGFPVVAENDIPCVWFNAVQHLLRYKGHRHYGFATDYLPGYTAEEKHYMLEQLHDMQQEYRTDEALVALLDEYREEIETDTATDPVKFDVDHK